MIDADISIFIRHWILSTILGTCRTQYRKILSTSTVLEVQVHVLCTSRLYSVLVLKYNVLKSTLYCSTRTSTDFCTSTGTSTRTKYRFSY